MSRVLATIVSASFLAACGLKGPLYLPEKKAEEQTIPAEEEREAQDSKPASPLLED